MQVRVTEKHFMAESAVFYSQGDDFSLEHSQASGKNMSGAPQEREAAE
jgi:hypothetical protein